MKNKIVSLLLSIVLMAGIINCFIPGNKLPTKSKIVEAGHLQAWIAWYQWIKAGGTWWGGGDYRNKPKPSSDGN